MQFSHFPPFVFWSLLSLGLCVLSFATVLMGFPSFLAKGTLFRARRRYYLMKGHRVVPYGYMPGFSRW